MKIKAAGFWVALVLTMGPALVAFLTDAQGQGWVDAGIAGAVILAINGLVKFIQVSGPQPQVPPSPPQGVQAMATQAPDAKSELSLWLLG